MHVFSGIFYRKGQPVSIPRIATIAHLPGEAVAPISAHAALLPGIQPLPGVYPHLFIAGDVELYNIQELALQLGVSGYSDAYILITHAYAKWGADCVRYFTGCFAFAMWDERNQAIFCARDTVAQKAVYYYCDDEVLLFSDSIHFPASFARTAAIDETWPAKLLHKAFANADNEKTPYKYIKKLLPGHTLTVTPGKVTIAPYNTVATTLSMPGNMQEAVEGVNLLLANAVNRTMTVDGANGIELSGGLDSSSVAAYLKNAMTGNASLYGFSNALPPQLRHHYEGFTDETGSIGVVARHLGINDITYLDHIQQNPMPQLRKALDAIGYPVNVTVHIMQQPIYEAAQHKGVNTLFSGFGGDEFVSSNVYSPYVAMMVRQGRLAKAAGEIHAHGVSNMKAYGSALYRYAAHLLTGSEKGPATISRNVSMDLLKMPYAPIPDPTPTTLDEWYVWRIQSHSLYERLESGYLITRMYGLKYRFPLLDADLLQYFFSLPDEYKRGFRNGRPLLRLAVQNMLPQQIVHGKKPHNTYVIPTLKAEAEMHFKTLKDALLSMEEGHRLYDYVNRTALQSLQFSPEIATVQTQALKRKMMLAMFFDDHKARRLHDV